MQVTQTHRSSLAHNGDGERSTTIIPINNIKLFIIKRIIILLNCIVYSPHKYRETEGKKRILVAIFGIKAELKKLNRGMFTLTTII
nr:MAG TPA_asm: hypothetical protein [Caudoviricetes sp.]